MRSVTGTIVSVKMNKTIVVKVSHYKIFKKYHKRYSVSKKYYAHDARDDAHRLAGDTITIYECRPLSKLKRWTTTPPEGAQAERNEQSSKSI